MYLKNFFIELVVFYYILHVSICQPLFRINTETGKLLTTLCCVFQPPCVQASVLVTGWAGLVPFVTRLPMPYQGVDLGTVAPCLWHEGYKTFTWHVTRNT